MEKRRFSAGALHHVYFITRDGGVLFYRISDRLSFYTTISVLASRYKVDIIGISIMFTHVHLMVRARDLSSRPHSGVPRKPQTSGSVPV